MDTQGGDRKTLTYYMRSLHRDIGFLVIGLTIVYALSGIVLIYRDTDFLKTMTHVETTMPKLMSPNDISQKLRLRHMEVTKIEGDVIHFKDGDALPRGAYNAATGATVYDRMQLPKFLQTFISLHKISSSKGAHSIGVVYGVMLLFLALSALAMFKPASRQFRRGLILSGVGVFLTILVLLLM